MTTSESRTAPLVPIEGCSCAFTHRRRSYPRHPLARQLVLVLHLEPETFRLSDSRTPPFNQLSMHAAEVAMTQ